MDAYIGEIRAFPYGFVPENWMECNGQALPINQNAELYSVIGTVFGGDGKTTFNLPDLRGAAALGAGTDAQGNSYTFGRAVGTPTVTLTEVQMPAHSHALQSQSSPPLASTPSPAVIPTNPQYTGGGEPSNYLGYAAQSDSLTPMAIESMEFAGLGHPHDNHSPYLVLRWCIAVMGVYPAKPS